MSGRIEDDGVAEPFQLGDQPAAEDLVDAPGRPVGTGIAMGLVALEDVARRDRIKSATATATAQRILLDADRPVLAVKP